VAGRLPSAVAAWIGRRLGDLGYALTPGRRRTALANLAQAFPASTVRARRRVCRASYQHLGVTTMELLVLLARPLREVLAGIRIDGLEHLRAAMDRHGRALLLTAHLGNWELLAAASRLTPYRLSVVVRPLDAPWLDGLATRLRAKMGVELIDKRQALRPVLRALTGGGMVGILLDQNAARSEGVFVPFFGRPASTSKGIAVLALRTGTPILPTFIRRETAGSHLVTIGPPLLADEGERPGAAVAALTARCTEAIEHAIRQTPEQWLWIHERWRTRPAAERATSGG
jgi:Kdo2-lipid IVA lauroyltransferase/acyltransferase